MRIRRGHHIGNLAVIEVCARIENPAQVTVSENALNNHVIVTDNRHTQFFTGDFHQCFAQ